MDNNYMGTNKKEKKESSLLAFILGMIMLAIIGIFLIILGGMDTFSAEYNDIEEMYDSHIESGDFFEGNVEYASKNIYSIEHSYYNIPTGTEYYYYIFSDDYTKGIVVKADKDFADLFDRKTFEAKGTVTVKGKICESPSEISKLCREDNSDLRESGIDLSIIESYYLDLTNGKNAMQKIIAGVIVFLSIIMFIILRVKKDNEVIQKVCNVIAYLALLVAVFLVVF